MPSVESYYSHHVMQKLVRNRTFTSNWTLNIFQILSLPGGNSLGCSRRVYRWMYGEYRVGQEDVRIGAGTVLVQGMISGGNHLVVT